MDKEYSLSAQRQLDRFCRQYLQVQFDIDYPEAQHLRGDTFQNDLYSRLFAENAIKHAPPPRYQLRVLKELTKRIENSIQDWNEEGISDDLMNSLAPLLALSLPSELSAAQQKSYVTYTLSHLPPLDGEVPTTTVLEARALIAGAGTTGLRTWEAALYLGNYLCSHPALIQGKSVLELGAGTGYTSILCSKHLGASHVISTDGSDDVVMGLATNFYLNGLQDSTKIEAKELKWGWALEAGEYPEWNAGRKIDLVVGADLTYDDRNIPALLSTFNDLHSLHPKARIIYAATERNPKTFDIFPNACRKNGWLVDEIEFEMLRAEEQMGPFYSAEVPIRLYNISKS